MSSITISVNFNLDILFAIVFFSFSDKRFSLS